MVEMPKLPRPALLIGLRETSVRGQMDGGEIWSLVQRLFGSEETNLSIVDNEGNTVREVKVSTEPTAIRSVLEGFADRIARVGVEASSLGMCCTASCRGSAAQAGVAVDHAQQDRS